MMSALSLPYKLAGAVAIVTLIYVGWQLDRANQRALGAAQAKAEFAELIAKSKELTDAQKNAALSAASAAAGRVCVEQGLPAADCQDL